MSKIFLIIFISFSLLACDGENQENASKAEVQENTFKVGFIYTGKVDEKGYTYTHDQARKKMVEKLGVESTFVENVTGDVNVTDVANDLIKQGCNAIYATSFEYMKDLASVAEKNPKIYFGHATGSLQLANMSNYMGKIYEARYLAGIVAGLNTKSNKIGYVAAMSIPEVIRGINAFALGVNSVNKNAVIEVDWTGEWENPEKEKQIALELIDRGADIIAQHTDTHFPQVAAAERGILAIGYNNSTKELFPNTYLTAPIFNWETFYIDDVSAIMNGTWKSRSYYEGINTNMVALDEINGALAVAGTKEKVEEAKKVFIEGRFNVFSGPIFDNQRKLRVAEGKSMSDDEIHNMTFFVNNVKEIKNIH